MYLCVCAAVTDSDIQKEINQGVCCFTELKERLGIASCCGQCEPATLAYVNSLESCPASRCNFEQHSAAA